MRSLINHRLITTALSAGLFLSGVSSAANLTIWLTGDPTEVSVMKTATDLYTKAHPDVTFSLQAIPWSDAHAKVLAAAAARSGPDIISGGLSWGIELGKLGGMVDLSTKYPALTSMVKKSANPGVLQSVISTDGKLYAIPYALTVQLQYLRPDLLKAAGVAAAPKTWDQLSTDIGKLQTGGKKGYVVAWGNLDWIGYFPYLYQAGGSLYDKTCTKATINSPEGVKALDFFASLYNKYKLPTDANPDLGGGLDNGNYPLGTSYSTLNFDTTYPKMAGKWAISKLPAGPTGKSTAFIGGTVIGVTSYSKNADVAADFLATLYQPQVAQAVIKGADRAGVFFIPPRTDFAQYLNLPADRKTALIAQLKDAAGPPNCNGWEASTPDVLKAIQSVILNKADPKAALDQAAAAMNSNLKR